MALPSSGEISLSDIYQEIEGLPPSDLVSLRDMSSTAGFDVPDNISKFHGYSPGDDIILTWASNIIYYTNEFDDQDGYRQIIRSGHTAGTIVSITIDYSLTLFNSGTPSSGDAGVYYRRNSGSWVLIDTFMIPGIEEGSYTISNITSSDNIELRVTASARMNITASANVKIASASITSGSGSINIQGLNNWGLIASDDFMPV